MRSRSLAIPALALAAMLGGCAGPSPLGFPPNALPSLADSHVKAKSRATLSIAIPHQTPELRVGRHLRYVSPATQSIGILVSSTDGTTKSYAVNLTAQRNRNCAVGKYQTICKLAMSLPPGRYTGTFSTYDGPVVNKAPTGTELSSNQNIPFTVRHNKTSSIKVVLEGIATTLAFIPAASSTLSGSQLAGYSIPRCSPAPQEISIVAVDGDGNYILGAGAPKITVHIGSPIITLSTPQPTSPNMFILTPPAPPAYQPSGTTVYVEALASVPNNPYGVNAVAKISFGGGLCGIVTEFPIPTAGSRPWGITVGPDNAIWFTELNSGKIGRIPTTATPTNTQMREFSLPTSNAGPHGIAAGPDGTLWFTECYASQIGHMPVDGSWVQEFPTLTQPSYPRAIAKGPDGSMWFTEPHVNAIGSIPTSGTIRLREFSIPTAASVPSGIAAGADGAMWFTEVRGNRIGRIPVSGSPITETSIATTNGTPNVITTGPDGKLWFTECLAGKIGNVPTTGSPITEFAAPTATITYGITTGPDGAMWFAQVLAGGVGRVTTDGAMSIMTIPVIGSEPVFIVGGPDGNLWFTDEGTNSIGRLQ